MKVLYSQAPHSQAGLASHQEETSLILQTGDTEPPGLTATLLPAQRWMVWLPSSPKIGSACC